MVTFLHRLTEDGPLNVFLLRRPDQKLGLYSRQNRRSSPNTSVGASEVASSGIDPSQRDIIDIIGSAGSSAVVQIGSPAVIGRSVALRCLLSLRKS